MQRSKTHLLTRASLTASGYVVLTLISNAMGLANGPVQLRLSESLSLLPVLFPESIWGLFIGCFISNAVSGCVIWDTIFGSLATLAAAYLVRAFRSNIYLASLMPVIINTLVIPLVLRYAYSLGNAWWYMCVTVALGELICCTVLAPMLIKALKKHGKNVIM